MTAKTQRTFTLSDADLMAMGSHAVARAYPKNTIIVSEGDRTDSLYIILEGRVKAFVADDRGHELVLSTRCSPICAASPPSARPPSPRR